jgi:hypothetical protein
MDSCSRRSSCGGFIVCEEVACSGCGACGGRCGGYTGTSRATGCGGVSDIAGAVEAAEIGDGSGRELEGFGGSGSLEEAIDAWWDCA